MDPAAYTPFVLYVVWHPEYAHGMNISTMLHRHFSARRYQNVGGGVRVIFRNAVAPGYEAALPIDWEGADTTAAVILLERKLANDPAWSRYILELAGEASAVGLNARVFPVAMEPGTLSKIGIEEQALRWNRWEGGDEKREQKLVRDLTYEFSRMLRHRLAHLRNPDNSEDSLGNYMRKIKVFLSHSKHDDHGERISEVIRDWLHSNSSWASFLDVRDIPAGLPFPSVIVDSIQGSVVVAIYTDSYSSREWCCREVIEAKCRNVPMLVVDCLQGVDERSFPYLGNVPVVRMDPDRMDRIDQMAGHLIDEVFKDFLWRCRVERLRSLHPQTLFIARVPELISLASLPARGGATKRSIVYPDPPMSVKEARLFDDVAHGVRLRSLTQWLGEH